MHAIQFVDDHDLPADHDFALVTTGRDDVVIFFRRSAVTPQVLEQSWAAYRALLTGTPQDRRLHSAS